MNKKLYTTIFTIISTIVNIVMTIAIIAALMFVSAFVYFKVLGNTEAGTSLAIALMISFGGGMILGLFLFTKLCAWVIEHFHLQPKIDPKVLGRYLPNGKKGATPEEPETKKTKTNIPKSPVMIDDEWARDVESGSSQQGHAPEAGKDDDDD